MKTKSIFFALIFVALSSGAQNLLKLEDAVNTAIRNHWSIQMADNLKRLSEDTYKTSYLELLPNISLLAATSRSSNNLSQQFVSGLEVDKRGVKASNTNGNLIADMTLFDGFRVYHANKRYKELTRSAEINLSIAKETIVFDVSFNYYGLIKKKQELFELKKSLGYSEERVKIADLKFQSGSTAKPEFLQALLDLNTRKSELLQKEQELIELKAIFNTLIGQDAAIDFDVSDTLSIAIPEDLNTLYSIYKKNKEIELQNSLIKVSEYQLKENRSAYYPKITATGNYTFSLNKSQAGFQLFNRTTGMNGGLGVSWNLFTGGTRKIISMTDKTKIANLRLEEEQINYEIRSRIYSQYRKLKNAAAIYAIEKENYKLSTENLNIATERYREGLSSIIELLEAQRSSDVAAIRLINSNFENKIAELDLKRITGQLYP